MSEGKPDPESGIALDRFKDAQASVYAQALSELRAGRKRSHWMWFIFPQMKGLGRSPMAEAYGIASLDEARAFLADPILGGRLRECTTALLEIEGRTANEILGSPDDLKLRSSMTLFSAAATDEVLFDRVIDRYYGGEKDPRTLALIGAG